MRNVFTVCVVTRKSVVEGMFIAATPRRLDSVKQFAEECYPELTFGEYQQVRIQGFETLRAEVVAKNIIRLLPGEQYDHLIKTMETI